MRINYISLLIALLLSALLAWGIYSLQSDAEQQRVLGVVSFITLAVSSAGTVALSVDQERPTTLIRTTAGCFFLLFLIVNGGFSLFDFSPTLYIIVNTLILLVLLLLIKGLANLER